MAALKDLEQLADDLENLVGQFRSELKDNPDFEKLVQIFDEISEHADNAATTFSNVNDALMSRLQELSGSGGGKSRKSGNGSGSSRSREKAEATSSNS